MNVKNKLTGEAKNLERERPRELIQCTCAVPQAAIIFYMITEADPLSHFDIVNKEVFVTPLPRPRASQLLEDCFNHESMQLGP